MLATMLAAVNETLMNSTGSMAADATRAVVQVAGSQSASDAAAAAAQKAMMLYLQRKFHVLQVMILLGYSVMFLLCIALIGHLRFNRSGALKGDSTAARKVILPAFEPLLWILGTATGLFAVYMALALALGWYAFAIPAHITECIYSGRQFVFLMVVVYMLQKSVSMPALRRTVAINLVLSTYTIPLQFVLSRIFDSTSTLSYVALTAGRGLLLLLYAYIAVQPPGRASARTLREYCAFAFVYYALSFTYNELFHHNLMDAAFVMTYITISWGALCPLVIWRVLQADTEHWRGMGQRACQLQSLFRQKHQLDERVSSQGLHVLIEMHRKYIIDFAYLELKQKIGMGSSATVFNGVMHSNTPVAIKVYTPTDFTEETVAEFSHEAALCGALHHPNIVKFYGMCVFPPTICLVSELCQGSLADITCATAKRKHHSNRQQQVVDLGYMLDAARAVAYIHSFSPAFIHRDIKPSNFLVDAEHNVKLTDFGESRSLAKTQAARQSSSFTDDSSPTVMQSGTEVQHVDELDGESTFFGATSSDNSNYYVPAQPTPPLTNSQSKMTVKGTVDYMAPEMIKGKAGQAEYGEAADVYSLAMTMWDILNPGAEKFPTLKNNHLQVFEFVIDGKRPRIETSTAHQGLRQVIESAWQADPRLRPSAQQIVRILESIQEEMQATFAQELMNELKFDMVAMGSHSTATLPTLFTGEHAVSRMEDMQYVSSTGEAIRLGNALMDAGLLHHHKHARAFENADALYYFDEENIVLCKPICVSGGGGNGTDTTSRRDDQTAMLDADSREQDSRPAATPQRSERDLQHPAPSLRMRLPSEHSSQTGTDRSRSDQLENGMCSCRKLGQRLEGAKGSRRRYRRKFKPISEENVLTAKLLAIDTTQVTLADDDFNEFDAGSTPHVV